MTEPPQFERDTQMARFNGGECNDPGHTEMIEMFGSCDTCGQWAHGNANEADDSDYDTSDPYDNEYDVP
jgi:hypothetical protein